MNKNILNIVVILLILILASTQVIAEEDDDFEVFGLELEKLLFLGSSLLALGLFIITYVAYNRTKRKKLIFVSVAFLLFSVKTFFLGSELFMEEIEWIDPLSAFMDFIILLSFFYGMIKK